MAVTAAQLQVLVDATSAVPAAQQLGAVDVALQQIVASALAAGGSLASVGTGLTGLGQATASLSSLGAAADALAASQAGAASSGQVLAAALAQVNGAAGGAASASGAAATAVTSLGTSAAGAATGMEAMVLQAIAVRGAAAALESAQASGAAATLRSAEADAALMNAHRLLADAEIAVTQGADLAAAATRNLATSLAGEDAAVLTATANLNANAAANVRAAAAMGETESGAVGLGSSGMGLLAIGAGLVTVKLVEMGAGFGAQMSRIEGFAGVAHSEMAGLSSDVLALSASTGASAKSIADGLYYARSAGLSTSDGLVVLERSIRLANAAGIETKPVVDVTTSAMNAYGESAGSLAHIQDVLTATTVAGKLQFGDLTGSLGRVLPIAAAMHISLEEVGASVAQMTEKGIPAASAVNSLQSIIAGLEKPTKAAQSEMKLLGTSAEEVRQSIADRGLLATLSDLMQRTNGNVVAMEQLFPNFRALRGVLADTGSSTQDYVRILDQENAAYGRSQAAIDAYQQTSQYKIHQFTAAVSADLIQAGAAVATFAATWITAGATIADALGKLEGPLQRVKDVWDLLPGPVRAAVEDYTKFVLLTNPVTGGIMAVKTATDALTDAQNDGGKADRERIASVQGVKSAFDGSWEGERRATDAIITNTDAANMAIEKYGILTTSVMETSQAHSLLKTVVTEAASSTQAADAVQQAYANSVAAVADKTTDWKARHKELTDAMKDGTPAQQAVLKLQDEMDTIVGQLGPDTAAYALEHQHLLDTLSKSSAAALPFEEELAAIVKGLGSTSDAAKLALDDLLNLVTRPTKEIVDLRQHIDENKLAIGQWDAQVANSAPIDQRIAALVIQRDRLLETGGTVKEVQKVEQDLANQITASTNPAHAAQVAAQQHVIDQLTNTNAGLEANMRVLQLHQQTEKDTVDKLHGHALAQADVDKALQTTSGVVHTELGKVNTDLSTNGNDWRTWGSEAGTSLDAVALRAEQDAARVRSSLNSMLVGAGPMAGEGRMTAGGAAGQVLSATDLARGLLAAGMDPSKIATQVALLLAENGGQVVGTSAAGAVGFGQLMPGFGGISEANRLGTSPEALAAQFAAIVRGQLQQGFSAWDPYNYRGGGNPAVNYGEVYVGPGRGSYQNYLAQAQAATAGLNLGAGGGQLPVPTPETVRTGGVDAATQAQRDLNTAIVDTNTAQADYNHLLDVSRDLGKSATDSTHEWSQEQITTLHDATEAARAHAAALYSDAEVAYEGVLAALGGYDTTTKASRQYTQAEIQGAQDRYKNSVGALDEVKRVFDQDLSAESSATTAFNAQQKADAAAALQRQKEIYDARRQLASDSRADAKAEGDAFAQMFRDASASAEGFSSSVAQTAVRTHTAWHLADQAVLADDQALQDALVRGAEATEITNLRDKLAKDRDTAADAKLAAGDVLATWTAEVAAEKQLNTDLRSDAKQLSTYRRDLAKDDASSFGAGGAAVGSAAQQAVAAWQVAAAQVLADDQALQQALASNANDTQAAILRGKRDTDAQVRDDAKGTADAAIQDERDYVSAVKSADAELLHDRASVFDLEHKLTHLTYEEKRVGLAGWLQAEIDTTKAIAALEQQLKATTDPIVQQRLQREIDADKQRLASDAETVRELEAQAQDLAGVVAQSAGQSFTAMASFAVPAFDKITAAAKQTSTAVQAVIDPLKELLGVFQAPSLQELNIQVKVAQLNLQIAKLQEAGDSSSAYLKDLQAQAQQLQAQASAYAAERAAMVSLAEAQGKLAAGTATSIADLRAHMGDLATAEQTTATAAVTLAQALGQLGGGLSQATLAANAWNIAHALGAATGVAGGTFAGGGAPPASAGGGGATFAGGGAPLLHFQHGGYVTEDMLAFVHRGEYVIPATMVEQGAVLPPGGGRGGGGGDTFVFAPNITAWDSQDVRRNMPTLAREFDVYLRQNRGRGL